MLLLKDFSSAAIRHGFIMDNVRINLNLNSFRFVINQAVFLFSF